MKDAKDEAEDINEAKASEAEIEKQKAIKQKEWFDKIT